VRGGWAPVIVVSFCESLVLSITRLRCGGWFLFWVCLFCPCCGCLVFECLLVLWSCVLAIGDVWGVWLVDVRGLKSFGAV